MIDSIQGAPLTAKWGAAIPASLTLGLSIAGVACGGESSTEPAETTESICNDQLDNDGDGLIDCNDSDCAKAAVCQGVKYGVPLDASTDVDAEAAQEAAAEDVSEDVAEDVSLDVVQEAAAEICNDNFDNDGDGLIDCADLDCKFQYPYCVGAEYGAPF